MNNLYTNGIRGRAWIFPVLTGATLIIATLIYLSISEDGRGLIGLGAGANVECDPISIGATVNGVVSESPGYDCYELASDDPAIQGTAISISLNSSSGSHLDVDIYAPGSEVELGNAGYAWVTAYGVETKTGTLALNKGTGTYKIKVWSYSKGQGGYEFSVTPPPSTSSESVTAQVSDASSGCIEILTGTAVLGNIDVNNKYDCYTFAASQNDNVVINMISKDGTSLDVDLYNPGTAVTEENTGFKWVTASGATPITTLSTPLDEGEGTYSVKAWSYGNAGGGNYELTISLNSGTETAGAGSSETCDILNLKDSASGTISSGDEYDCFKYSAMNGDVITVQITSLSGSQLDADIFEPDSSSYKDGAGFFWISTLGKSKTSKTFTLDKGDGDYIVKAWSYGNGGFGDYELNITSESTTKTSPSSPSATTTETVAVVATPMAATIVKPQPVTSNEATTTTGTLVKKSNRPEPLSQVEKIVAFIESPTDIDPDTGCGHRNYGKNTTGLIYPDGITRTQPLGDRRHMTRGGSYSLSKYSGISHVQYYEDWLGISEDYYEAIAIANELHKAGGGNQGNVSTEIRQNTTVVFGGNPLLYGETDKKLKTSTQIDDVGYWDFTDTGGNAVAGGYDWDFSSNQKGENVLFHDGILDVPYLPGDSWGVSGSVNLQPRAVIDKSLHRDKFTVAFSVLPEVFPTELPTRTYEYDKKGQIVKELTDWTEYYEKHTPRRLLLSFGNWYRWLQINVNELCQVEVELNLSPYGDFRKHHNVFLVSQVELDIKRWNEIQFTINIPENQASLTVLDGSELPNDTEIFTLPEDFEWSFTSDWKTSDYWLTQPNVHYVDNSLGLFSGSGSGSFGGKLDWIYIANGIMDPIGVERRVAPLRESGHIAREPAVISVSPDGYSASAQLSTFDYPEWESGAFVNSSMRNNLMKDVYSKLEDDFDFVFLVQNEESTELEYLGMYRGISNDLKGISEDEEGYDSTKYSGSDGKLKAVIHLPYKYGICCGPSLHELTHHWGNYSLATGDLAVSTFDTNVINPEDAMDEINAGSHWGVSSVNGQLGGFDLSTLEELGDNWYTAAPFGTYANGGNSIPYGNLELYLMGLIPPEEVEDVIMFKGLGATAGDFFDDGMWYAEEKVTITADDIIKKLGPRFPDHNNSQKEFKILTLVLTDHPLSDEEWTDFSKQAKDFEDTFRWATGDRASAKLGSLDKSIK